MPITREDAIIVSSLNRRYITEEEAVQYAPLSSVRRWAQKGSLPLVTINGVQYWLGYVIPHGFYLEAYEPLRGIR